MQIPQIPKKYAIVAWGILALFMVLGCISSGSSNNHQTDTATATVTPNSQDQAWIDYVVRSCAIISPDFKNAATAAQNEDIASLRSCGMQIVVDMGNIIEENKKYETSGALSAARYHWALALTNLQESGVMMVTIADEGATNPDHLQELSDLCEAGTKHLDRTNELLAAYP